ncbi:hypothetical protein [Corynebacterium provencense]|uniref:hypothetical protein n=1 Tax=Corynebacterium provencense TaxID=1737425 RepID=UPI000AEA55BF|nr:hypothetical protein [Corynebacterium provencense]
MAEKKPAVARKQCGTTAGYRQHIKRGEQTCEACRAAHREHERARRAGEIRPRGESRAKKWERQEAAAAVVVDGPPVGQEGDRPAFLKRQGRALWDEITGAYDLDAGAKVVLGEACRMRDRLERFSAALSVQSTLWFELGEPEELRTGDVQVQVVVNNMIGEARQMQAAVATALNKIGVLKQAEAKSDGPSVEDQLAEKRAARRAAAAKAAREAGE